MYPSIQLRKKQKKEKCKDTSVVATIKHAVRKNTYLLNAKIIASGTRPVVVLVNQTWDKIRGYTNDQSISNDRKNTKGLQHVCPDTCKEESNKRCC